MSTSFIGKTVKTIHEALKNQVITCTQLIEQHFSHIQAVDPQVKAFLSLMKDQALEQAAKQDALFKQGSETRPLAGIPIAIKDNLCIQGSKTTCGSKILEHFVAPYTATVIEKIKASGLIALGKTNLDEFAMGSSTENSAFFATKNPWNTDYVPGGSSGGSAAAVASGQAVLALGSDTGGSIRQPAALCGISGMKPTYGRVSRYGLVAFASSLDQVGPFAQSVEDIALLLNAICGHDSHDSTSSTEAVPDFTQALTPSVQGLKIGVPTQLLSDTVDPAVKAAFVRALDTLKAQGATWDTFDMNELEACVSTYYILAPAEASANLSRFDGVRYGHRNTQAQGLHDMMALSRGEGFGPEVKRRILLGTYVLSSGYYDAYYAKAQQARTLVKHHFSQAFKQFDVIATPTSPSLPFKLGEHSENPLSMYLADIATIPVNLAGLPGLSIPCGFHEGLPIGFQLIGKHFDEATLLKTGHTYQTVTDYHLQRAPLCQ